MKLLDDMVDFYKSFDLNKTILEAVEENESVILDLNANSQLFEEGITSRGIPIANFAPYSPVTVEIKKMKGQPTNRVTLYDEGDFYESMFIVYVPDGFIIRASDWKTEALMVKYGGDILGLTEENIKYLAEEFIVPYVLNKLRYERKG